MIPSKNRIKKRKDFEAVFHKGRTFLEHFFILKERENKLKYSRFAIVVPVKIERRAAKRNRTKRVYSDIVRKNIPSFKKELDVIIIIKKEGKGAPYLEIKEEIKKVLEKVTLI
jgi:ribonuclease P protein component